MRAAQHRLGRLIALSRAALAWESLWRALSWVVAAVALFLALSWAGLWLHLPGPARAAGVAALAALAIAGAWREWRWPARDAAIRRLDGDAAALAPGLASSLTDELAQGGRDPATEALWRAHRARLERALDRASVAPPAPRMDRRDGRALRVGALLAALVAAIAAGDERNLRLASAFHWSAPAGLVAAPTRLDVWIDPPAYTGRAPIVLTGDSRGESRTVSAPVGSVVVVRATPPGSVEATVSGGLTPLAQEDRAQENDAQSAARPARDDGARRYTLKGAATLDIPRGRGVERIEISVIPDAPPTVELTEQPRAAARGALTLFYRLGDDYGVAGAEAVFDAPELPDRPAEGRLLHEPPRVQLPLGAGPGGLGEARFSLDLSDHPWAGARVRLTVRARDAAGNEGASAPIHVFLPQRPFTNPLARALVEQRRNLALEPARRDRVLAGLAALMYAPDDMKAGAYLGLRTAFARLRMARSDEALRGVVDYLWAVALEIEGGDLSDIERELRSAAERLREALRNGATPEEIKRLTEDLRAAMDKFLQALAERQGRQNERADQAPQPNARAITPDQLRDMLNRMESMAREGDMADARRMLDRLQDMLDNLRTARRGQQSQQSREMGEALRELDELTQQQQQLRDEAYRDRPGQGDGEDDESGARPNGGGSGQDGAKGLAERQQKLRERLERLRRRLGKNGDRNLGDAEQAMREAEDALGKDGRRGRAVDAQGRAIESLRRGAGQLAQRMREQADGQGQGEGEGGEPLPGGPRQADADGERDPLGRERGRRNDSRARYDPLGQSPALRAQRVLEELRRRLGEPTRPQEELDYLERLIRRY